MNKAAIKNYAIWARVQLIESCKQKAYEYGITEDGENRLGLSTVGSRILNKKEIEQRNQLISRINQKGYSQVMEEVAYTWFNRFIALRFMEINGYLPSKIRVMSNEEGAFKPEIIKEAMTVELEGLDRNTVLDFIEKQDNEGLYKYLLITQCNALNRGLPYMFERISNWTELLFPSNILRNDSVIGQMVTSIPEEDWTDQIQIIGWLYQYYNSELKDETFALLKKNTKIVKERIPAATQLFTPDWIVRYMVENSLGRLWYEGHLGFDKSHWKFFLDETEQEAKVQLYNKCIHEKHAELTPENIKVIDPAMGSGHILVYAFDVLMQIYTSFGWSERDAAKSIIEHNLYGLDIDDRAGQLAYFAVMMKARKYSRRILNGETKPNLLSVQDSRWMEDDFISYVAGADETIKADLIILRKTFQDAKEYGSIIIVPVIHYELLFKRIEKIREEYAEDLVQLQYNTVEIERLHSLLTQSYIMSQEYDVVVTNPPYMGSSGMSSKLDSYVKEHYPNSKNDLFSVFIEKCSSLIKIHGYQALITQHAWMFLSGFEELRRNLLNSCTIINMAHLGARAFDEIAGEVVQTTAFVLRKGKTNGYKGLYKRLLDGNDERQKAAMLIGDEFSYNVDQDSFLSIPSNPIGYWLSDALLDAFSQKVLSDYGTPKVGLQTGDNDAFVRVWFEVPFNNLSFDAVSTRDTMGGTKKWFPYNKGGSFRKWYGNNDYIVNWENDGYGIKHNFDKNGKLRARPQNTDYYFKESISWSKISMNGLAFRYKPPGGIFDVAGTSVFSELDTLKYLIGLCNSIVAKVITEVLSPTLNYEVGHIANIPVIVDEGKKPTITRLAEENIRISKNEWDSFETSWDFKKHPLV